MEIAPAIRAPIGKYVPDGVPVARRKNRVVWAKAARPSHRKAANAAPAASTARRLG